MRTTSARPAEPIRTSLYLVRRAEAVIGALRFFLDPTGDARQRRMSFLAQSDFWEWEVDNLIYSFVNFDERSRTWRSPRAVFERLGQLGIVVPSMMSSRPIWRQSRWRTTGDKRRVAPI